MAESQPRTLVVVMKPAAGLRASPQAVESVSGADVSGLTAILDQHGATLSPMFGPSEDALIAKAGSMHPSAEIAAPDLSRYYRVQADDAALELLQHNLLAHPLVEGAYIKPAGEPPRIGAASSSALNIMQPTGPAAATTTPDYTGRQGYLGSAPGGVDAVFGSTVAGGTGSGVDIIDCEWNWNLTHEDLANITVAGGTPNNDNNHGTAVLGVINAVGAVGVTGIASGATVRVCAFSSSASDSSSVVHAAADLLGAGDILLLEIHRPGPLNGFQGRNDQLGYIAIEWWPDDLAAIQYAVSRGILVVEAAGNGQQNLDDPLYEQRPSGFPPSWVNPFNRANADSGAILVGAGAPPQAAHGKNVWGPDRARLDFSNYGNAIDAQGWGREVTTTGYGDLQGGGDQNVWYTDTFAGTSSASPIVVGSLASVQGALRQAARTLLTPSTARTLLRGTGSPQQDAPGRPASQRIGNRPDIKAMMAQLGLS